MPEAIDEGRSIGARRDPPLDVVFVAALTASAPNLVARLILILNTVVVLRVTSRTNGS